MKITKAEKSLWTFLNIFKSIISKSGQTIMVGNRGTLVIGTLSHYGVFKYKSDGMIDDYEDKLINETVEEFEDDFDPMSI